MTATKGTYSYDYPRPMVTADIVVLRQAGGRWEILLIERGRDPFRGRWALPGGFMEIDEDLETAAARELHEETGLHGCELRQLGAFGRVGRDPRGRTVSVVYITHIDEMQAAQVRAGDDAAKAQWFDIRALPDMAFDHGEIVAAALEKQKVM